MEKYYRFAGLDVTVDIPEGQMYEEERQLAAFRAEKGKDPHVFRFEAVERLSAPAGGLAANLPGLRVYREGERDTRYIGTVAEGWENAYCRTAYGEKEHLVQVRLIPPLRRIGVKTVLNAMGVEHLVAMNGGFVFHCSYIDIGGKAILFTAPSGTGKSTQADLWQKYRKAEIVNGDRAAVRVKDGTVVAEGIPFSGSSSYCLSRTLPITAIVYLSQAPQTTIRKLRGMEAFSRIWEGVSVNTWSKADVEGVSDAVQKTASEIPVYHLACTPDESAVAAVEDAIRKWGEL